MRPRAAGQRQICFVRAYLHNRATLTLAFETIGLAWGKDCLNSSYAAVNSALSLCMGKVSSILGLHDTGFPTEN